DPHPNRYADTNRVQDQVASNRATRRILHLIGQDADGRLSPCCDESEHCTDRAHQPGLIERAERGTDGSTERQEGNVDSKEEQEEPYGSDHRSLEDLGDLADRQPQQEDLKNQEKQNQRRDRDDDASCDRDELMQPRGHHDRSSPMRRIVMIGPTDAKPATPNPSATGERPASTELTPIASAMMTGADKAPVVTLPPSKASEMNSGGANNASRSANASAPASRYLSGPPTTRRAAARAAR